MSRLVHFFQFILDVTCIPESKLTQQISSDDDKSSIPNMGSFEGTQSFSLCSDITYTIKNLSASKTQISSDDRTVSIH